MNTSSNTVMIDITIKAPDRAEFHINNLYDNMPKHKVLVKITKLCTFINAYLRMMMPYQSEYTLL